MGITHSGALLEPVADEISGHSKQAGGSRDVALGLRHSEVNQAVDSRIQREASLRQAERGVQPSGSITRWLVLRACAQMEELELGFVLENDCPLQFVGQFPHVSGPSISS